jgi:hypothetical protein
MIVMVSIPRQQYRGIRAHLFRNREEQGCFLFAHTFINSGIINLFVKRVHLIKEDKWDHQSSFHLELSEKEKVKVMLMARKNNYDLIECHSHISAGAAGFSVTDLHGLDEFIRYVWWKMPGSIYTALVWTKNDIAGQTWLPKQSMPLPISEIRIVNKKPALIPLRGPYG